MSKNVLIIGTGLGGLAAALRLVKRGYKVQMVEKFKQPGGRLNQITVGGFKFDIGPTIFSMSYEFDELVKDCNITLPFTIKELEPLYAVNFNSHERTYYIYKDLKRFADQFIETEPDFENKLNRYLKSAGNFYNITDSLIIKSNYNSVSDFLLKLFKIPVIYTPKLFKSIWQEASRYFSSYEVRTIMSLVAFFLGSTPFNTMAIYNVLNYTELIHDGYYSVEGGMYKIVEGLTKLLAKEGVKFYYNTEIVDYKKKNNTISGFFDQHGNVWDSEIYIINADAALFRNKLFKRDRYNDKRIARMKWSMAPFTIYLVVKGTIDNLYYHHYFLGDNFKVYSSKIFKNDINLNNPYYYVNLISKTNDNTVQKGYTGLFILCPVPDLRFKSDWEDKEKVADNIIEDLSKRLRFNIKSNIVADIILTPVQWQQMFNLYKGSGLGLAHNFTQIGGFRPKNYDEVFDNVYYVGSSTVPGTGLPMAIISSKLVTERIFNKYGPLS